MTNKCTLSSHWLPASADLSHISDFTDPISDEALSRTVSARGPRSSDHGRTRNLGDTHYS